MKNLPLIPALLLLIINASAGNDELKQLLRTGKIEMHVTSTGAYQEDCLAFTIANKTGRAVDLELLPGMQFNSLNEGEQDLIVTSVNANKLGPNEKLSFIAKAYCFQAQNAVPSKGGKYEFAEKQDTSLKRIAEFLSRRRFNPHINQNAIWAVSNKHSIAAIPDSSEALQSLRELLVQLTGQELPWYQHNYAHNRLSSGFINVLPVSMSADITFDLASDDYITVMLIDSDDRPCGFILTHWQKGGGNIKYPIAFSLKNLQRGNYSLLVKTKENTLYRRSFEV